MIALGLGAAVAVAGPHAVELTMLDTSANHDLVDRDLGGYGQLGTVCEAV